MSRLFLMPCLAVGISAGVSAQTISGGIKTVGAGNYVHSSDGCGAGTNNVRCGNHAGADPYANHPGWPLAHTDITACGTTVPAASTYYLVTANLGSDETAICITFDFTANTGWILDLGGKTITGRVLINSNMNSTTVLNGVINCNTSTPNACLKIPTAATHTSGTATQVEFLTITNGFVGAAQAYAFFYSGQPPNTAWTDTGYRLRFHNLTINNPHTSVGARSHGISIAASNATPGQSVQADNNLFTVPSDADQGWGMDLYNISDFSFNNNKCVLNTHDAGLGLNACFQWEPGTTTTPTTMAGVITYNDVTNNNNRSVRFWGICPSVGSVDDLTISNNIFRSINLDVADKRWGAVTLGEAGACLAPFTNTEVFGNVYEITRGQGVLVSGATGAKIHNESFRCPTGCVAGSNGAWTNVANASATGASAQVYNNSVIDFTAAAISPVIACGVPGDAAFACAVGGAATSTITYCSTGTPAGNGTLTEDNSLCE